MTKAIVILWRPLANYNEYNSALAFLVGAFTSSIIMCKIPMYGSYVASCCIFVENVLN